MSSGRESTGTTHKDKLSKTTETEELEREETAWVYMEAEMPTTTTSFGCNATTVSTKDGPSIPSQESHSNNHHTQSVIVRDSKSNLE